MKRQKVIMMVFGVQEEAIVIEEVVNVDVGIGKVDPGFNKEEKCGVFRLNNLEKTEFVLCESLNVPCYCS